MWRSGSGISSSSKMLENRKGTVGPAYNPNVWL